MEFIAEDFDLVYRELLKALRNVGVESITRKGQKITELFDAKFTVQDPTKCLAYCRAFSHEYLHNEFEFYLSGSNLLEDAIKCSSFWSKCSDDGETINSNYGKLLFHDRNAKGFTQFAHAVKSLKNNPQSKKAVMTLYDKENAYMSNDNPCTMFLRARIDRARKLHLTAYMRSSDIYYGLPYDVPFFIFVQHALIEALRPTYFTISLGTYTHIASSLHKYEYKEKELDVAEAFKTLIPYPSKLIEVYKKEVKMGLKKLKSLKETSTTTNPFMQEAWKVSKESVCMKKSVGACLTIQRYSPEKEKIEEKIINAYCGGIKSGVQCKQCAREDDNDKYYGDDCPSVHSEMKCIINAFQEEERNLAEATIYVTHGPCDACLKLCDFVGIRKVVYDKPYKTNYAHWPNIEVVQVENI